MKSIPSWLLALLILLTPVTAMPQSGSFTARGYTSSDRSVGAVRSGRISTHIGTHAHLVCRDRSGKVVWTRDADNMLTTVGANLYLTDTIVSGVSSPTWYVGLLYGTSVATFATADTMSSNGWATGTGGGEVTGTQVTNSTRPAFTPGSVSAGSVSNTGSPAVFTGNATVTLQGFIFVNNSTLAGTTGTLMGEGTFTAAPIAAGYTITVTVTDNVTPG